MRTNSFLRTFAALGAAACLAACSAADNPYAAIEDPPLLQAKLHTVTFQAGDASAIDDRGFTRMPPAPNYPGSVRVEAALWKVPEAVAAAPVVLTAPPGTGANRRYLLMAPTAPAGPLAEPDSGIVRDFYANVLGNDAVPQSVRDAPAGLRIHSVTYLVDDVVAAKKKLRDARIPITFDAVAITTAYLGDHKLLGITAPDGVIVELVETAAH